MKIFEVGQEIILNAAQSKRIFHGYLQSNEYLMINKLTLIFTINDSTTLPVNHLKIFTFDGTQLNLENKWELYNKQGSKSISPINFQNNKTTEYYLKYTENPSLFFIFKFNQNQNQLELKTGSFKWTILRDPNPLVQYQPYPYPTTKFPLIKPDIPVKINHPYAMSLNFTPDLPGQYKSFLTIEDAYGISKTIREDFKVIIPDLPCSKIVIVKPEQQNRFVNETVTIKNGCYNENYSYTWQLYDAKMKNAHPDSHLQLYTEGTYSKQINFSVCRGERYNICLQVTDSNGNINTNIKNFLLALAKADVAGVDADYSSNLAVWAQNDGNNFTELNDYTSKDGHPFRFKISSDTIAEKPFTCNWDIHNYLFKNNVIIGKSFYATNTDTYIFYINTNSSIGTKIFDFSNDSVGDKAHLNKDEWDYYLEWNYTNGCGVGDPLASDYINLSEIQDKKSIYIQKTGSTEKNFKINFVKYKDPANKYETKVSIMVYDNNKIIEYPIIQRNFNKSNTVKFLPGGKYQVVLEVIGNDGEVVRSDQYTNANRYYLLPEIKISINNDKTLKFEAKGNYHGTINLKYAWSITNKNNSTKSITSDEENFNTSVNDLRGLIKLEENQEETSKDDSQDIEQYIIKLTLSGKYNYVNTRNQIKETSYKEISTSLTLLLPDININ